MHSHGRIDSLRLIPALLFILLFVTVPALAAERDLVLEPMQPGPFAVGSMNFEISSSALSSILSQGRDAGQYQEGENLNGELLYIASLLENPDAAFTFDLAVPDDSVLYGDSAGSTVPFAGYVLYPTTDSNSRSDYDVFASPSLPRMQSATEAPIFADESSRYPVLVYSHGLGSHPTGFDLTFLKDLASHGYIVMALFHGDGRWEVTEGRSFNLRPLAVKTALDVLLAHADFVDHIDSERIGGIGESYGGATMLALLGAKVVNPDVASVISNTLLTVQTDPRIKAAATVVPHMGAGLYSNFGRGGTGAAGVERPFLANAGTQDEVVDYEKVQEVFGQLAGDRYLVEFAGETHEFSEGATVDAWTWTKLFMDAKVKADATAIDNLSRILSVGDTGDDRLVIAVETDAGDPDSEPAPAAEPASFTNNVLSIPAVLAQGQTFRIGLTLQGESPPSFALTEATPVAAAEQTSASFDGSSGILSIPVVQIGDLNYSVELVLTSQDPVLFTLQSATEN